MEIYYIGDEERASAALDAMEEDGADVRTFDAPDTALIALRELSFLGGKMPDLVILEAAGPDADMDALRAAAMDMLRVHAFLYLSAATDVPYGKFHAAMEGLGMLRPMPAEPDAEDGRRLLANLRSLVQG